MWDLASGPENDLKDRNISQLVAVKYKKLDKHQRKWHTYEAELYGLVLVVKYFGSLITAATMHYPPGPDQVSKIGIWGDSTTAIGQWKSMTLPVGIVDHLSAKSRRFFSWADKVAGTIYWSLDLRHFPGDSISIPHMMTHMGDMARQRHADLAQANVSMIIAPTAIHSFHGDPPSPDAFSVPEGYVVSSLTLTADDVAKVHEALLADDSPYLSVPLHDIFKVVSKIDIDSVPRMHRAKITPWAGVRFFAITPPDADKPVLYAPTSFQVIHSDEHDSLSDPTSTLVMVIPKGTPGPQP